MKIMVNNTCVKFRHFMASSLVFLGIILAFSLTKPSYAATSTDIAFDKATQVAWFWGPAPYARDYYRWHHWSKWYPGATPGCHKRCLHNNWTGAVVRCERVCR